MTATEESAARRWLGFLLLFAALAVACGPQANEQEIEFRVPVFVQEVATGTVEDRILATGTLRAEETLALRSDTAGSLRVARDAAGHRLVEGDRVEAGQLVAEITGEEVRLAARTEATAQRYDAALRDYESKKQLFDQGLLSEQEFRPVETALADAKVELERSRLTETRSRLVTPIAGVLLHLARDDEGLPIADGQLVPQGQVLAQISPVRTLIAEVDLVGPDVSRVRVGLEARIRHLAWSDRVFIGKVTRLAPTLDPRTRTLRAELRVDNSEGLLRPGMFVEVTMIGERREGVPVVPREAVTERRGQKVVFVLKGQRVSRRAVALGLGDDEIVEIRQVEDSEGVKPGERIVVRGLETLSDGTRVRVSGS